MYCTFRRQYVKDRGSVIDKGIAMARRPVSAASVVCAATGQVSSRLSDEVVILNLEKGTYHGLEAVGGESGS